MHVHPREVVNLSASGLMRSPSILTNDDSIHSDVPRSFISGEGVELKVEDGIITFERSDGTKMIYGGRVEKIIEVLPHSPNLS